MFSPQHRRRLLMLIDIVFVAGKPRYLYISITFIIAAVRLLIGTFEIEMIMMSYHYISDVGSYCRRRRLMFLQGNGAVFHRMPSLPPHSPLTTVRSIPFHKLRAAQRHASFMSYMWDIGSPDTSPRRTGWSFLSWGLEEGGEVSHACIIVPLSHAFSLVAEPGFIFIFFWWWALSHYF